MNDINNGNITRTAQAETRRSRWPGWIWAVPIAAVAIVIWLGVRSVSNHGIDVTVVFDTAAGMEAGSTKVTYRGLEVGTVSDLALAKDGKHVMATLDMKDEMEPYLREGARFWLLGAKPSLSNLSSLKSIISGPTIAMEPGRGSSSRDFVGLDEPPHHRAKTGGQFELTADELGSVKQGSSVYYLGLEVGKVTGYHFSGPGKFRFDVFIEAPYDKLFGPARALGMRARCRYRWAAAVSRRAWFIVAMMRFSAAGSSGRLLGVIGTPAVDQICSRCGRLNHWLSQFAAAYRSL